MADKIDKLEAASEQLYTAIDLYFKDSCAISTHSLASSAMNILEDLVKNTEFQKFSLTSEILRYYKYDATAKNYKKVRGILCSSWNYFKHADRDKNSVLEFETIETEIYLLNGVRLLNLLLIKKNYNKSIWRILIFYVWFIINHREHLFSDDENLKFINDTLSSLPPKLQFLTNNKNEYYSEAVAMSDILENKIREKMQHIEEIKTTEEFIIIIMSVIKETLLIYL